MRARNFALAALAVGLLAPVSFAGDDHGKHRGHGKHVKRAKHVEKHLDKHARPYDYRYERPYDYRYQRPRGYSYGRPVRYGYDPVCRPRFEPYPRAHRAIHGKWLRLRHPVCGHWGRYYVTRAGYQQFRCFGCEHDFSITIRF